MENKKHNHQLELLKKYFPFDEEKKIAKIKIYYDSATELLDFSVGEEHSECFANEVLDKIADVTNKLPVGYKADVIIIVDDYADFKAEALLDKLNDMIEINNYQIIREKKKNWILAMILFIVGFSLLLFLGFAKKYGLFGTETVIKEGVEVASSTSVIIRKNIFEEMLDITSWVFVWQGVTVLFLTPSELLRIGSLILSKINSFSFSDSYDNVLATRTKIEFEQNWEKHINSRNTRSALLLFSSTFLVCLGAFYLTSEIQLIIEELIANSVPSLLALLVAIGVYAVTDLLVFICGILGILTFKQKKRARAILLPFSVVILIPSIIRLVLVIYYVNVRGIVSSIILLVIELIFVVTAFLQGKKSNIKKGGDSFEEV